MTFENDSDHFDQHFLIDRKVIKTFIDNANISGNDVIVEIGPGKGNITELLAKRAKKVYSIELDRRLKPFLDVLEEKYSNLKIIYGNVLDMELPKCNKIVTSLPYSIIEPFINKVKDINCDEIVMIIGNNFANNVVNNKITRLSLLTNCYFKANKIMDILPESFSPQPRTLSSIIVLKPLSVQEISSFDLLIYRFMFYYKDKKVKNALLESLIKVYLLEYNNIITKRVSKSIIEKLNISDSIMNKTFETCSNIELVEICDKIEGYDFKRNNIFE